jgi:hypothetical protein
VQDSTPPTARTATELAWFLEERALRVSARQQAPCATSRFTPAERLSRAGHRRRCERTASVSVGQALSPCSPTQTTLPRTCPNAGVWLAPPGKQNGNAELRLEATFERAARRRRVLVLVEGSHPGRWGRGLSSFLRLKARASCRLGTRSRWESSRGSPRSTPTRRGRRADPASAPSRQIPSRHVRRRSRARASA